MAELGGGAIMMEFGATMPGRICVDEGKPGRFTVVAVIPPLGRTIPPGASLAPAFAVAPWSSDCHKICAAAAETPELSEEPAPVWPFAFVMAPPAAAPAAPNFEDAELFGAGVIDFGGFVGSTVIAFFGSAFAAAS